MSRHWFPLPRKRTPYSKINWGAYPHRVFPAFSSTHQGTFGIILFFTMLLGLGSIFFALGGFALPLAEIISFAVVFLCLLLVLGIMRILALLPQHMAKLEKNRIAIAAVGPGGMLIGYADLRFIFNPDAKPVYDVIPFSACESITFIPHTWTFDQRYWTTEMLEKSWHDVDHNMSELAHLERSSHDKYDNCMLGIYRKGARKPLEYAFTIRNGQVLEDAVREYRPDLLGGELSARVLPEGEPASPTSAPRQEYFVYEKSEEQKNRHIRIFLLAGLLLSLTLVLHCTHDRSKSEEHKMRTDIYYQRNSHAR